ncbi:putative transposase [uncultured Desulfobacter sp.]|uniref:putative transposase n=1 Tax=uncultured Desulfobacter sp. TaxID=240139 RepID=UPI00374A072B
MLLKQISCLNWKKNRLLVRIHNASRPAANKKIQKLLEYLNDSEMNFPGTQLRLHYELASKKLWDENSSLEVS